MTIYLIWISLTLLSAITSADIIGIAGAHTVGGAVGVGDGLGVGLGDGVLVRAVND